MNDDIERIGEGLINKTMRQLVATLYLGKSAAETLARANAEKIEALEAKIAELQAKEKQEAGAVSRQVRRLEEVQNVEYAPEPG